MSPAPRLPCPWTCPFEEERGGPPAAGHCIFLQAPTGTDGSFYILSSSISCLTVSTVFYFLEYFILAFFVVVFNSILPPLYIMCSLFKVPDILRALSSTNLSDFYSESVCLVF